MNPSPRRNRTADRRMEILRAAAREFGLKGFEKATLEDIAAALGITRPALYHYAASKEQLLVECGAVTEAEVLAAVARANLQPTGRMQFITFFRDYAGIVCDDFGRCFVVAGPSEMNATLKGSERQFRRDLSSRIEAMLARGVEDGSIRRCDTASVVRLTLAAFVGIARWYTPGGKRTPSQIADEFLDVLIEGLAPRA
jgi:AcrR family transcriptional regulator